jgi:hypothetical protein
MSIAVARSSSSSTTTTTTGAAAAARLLVTGIPAPKWRHLRLSPRRPPQPRLLSASHLLLFASRGNGKGLGCAGFSCRAFKPPGNGWTGKGGFDKTGPFRGLAGYCRFELLNFQNLEKKIVAKGSRRYASKWVAFSCFAGGYVLATAKTIRNRYS